MARLHTTRIMMASRMSSLAAPYVPFQLSIWLNHDTDHHRLAVYATRTSRPSSASPTSKTSLLPSTFNTNPRGNGTTASPSVPMLRSRPLRTLASPPKPASLQTTTTSSQWKPRTYTHLQADPLNLVKPKDASGAPRLRQRKLVDLVRGCGPSSNFVPLAPCSHSHTLALLHGERHKVGHVSEKACADVSESTSCFLYKLVLAPGGGLDFIAGVLGKAALFTRFVTKRFSRRVIPRVGSYIVYYE
jgi:hypothetical protein